MTSLTLFCTLLIASSGVLSQNLPNLPNAFMQQFLGALQSGLNNNPFQSLIPIPIRPSQFQQQFSQLFPFLPQNTNPGVSSPVAIIGQQPVNTGGVASRPPRPRPPSNRPTSTSTVSTSSSSSTTTSLPVQTPEFSFPTVIPGVPNLSGSNFVAGINESELPVEEPLDTETIISAFEQ